MESNQVQSYFDNQTDKWDILYAEGRRSAFMRFMDENFRSDIKIRFESTFQFFGDITDKSILDIGCGAGPYILESINKGAKEITGIDISGNMIDICKEKISKWQNSHHIDLITDEFENHSFNKKFDFVIVMGVMDYVSKPDEFLKKILDVSNEKVAVSFPSYNWLRTPLRKVRYWVKKCPLYFYNRKRINDLVCSILGSEISFEIKKIPGMGMDFLLLLKKG